MKQSHSKAQFCSIQLSSTLVLIDIYNKILTQQISLKLSQFNILYTHTIKITTNILLKLNTQPKTTLKDFLIHLEIMFLNHLLFSHLSPLSIRLFTHYNIMSGLIQHFYLCQQVIKENSGVEEFKHHLNNFINSNQIDDKTQIQKLLSVLLKQIIIKHNESFKSFFDALVQKGVNLNFVETLQSKSLLMTACAEGNAETVRQLLGKGTSTYHKDARNQSCLFYALENKGGAVLDILNMLLEANPNLVKEQASNNRTILFAAVEKEKSQYVKFLLEKGAEPNEAISDQQDTPLHQAMRKLKNQKRQHVQNQLKNIIKFLLKYNANHLIKNKQGKTSIQINPNYQQFVNQEIKRIQAMKEQERKQKKQKQKVSGVTKSHSKTEGLETQPISTKNSKQNFNNKSLDNFVQRNSRMKQKYKQKQYKKPISNVIISKITNLRKTINELQTSISAITMPSQRQATPISNLYMKDQELKHYVQEQILQFSQNVEMQKAKIKPVIDSIVQTITQALEQMKITVSLYGSQATGLSLVQSDVNIAIVPSQSNLTKNQQNKLMNTVESHLKGVKTLYDVKKSLEPQTLQTYWETANRKIFIIIKLCRDIKVQNDRIALIKQYNLRFPQLKHLNYILKYVLGSVGMNKYSTGGLGNYGLLVLLAAYIKTEQQVNEERVQISAGEILLGFLYNFGLEFDYLDKGIFMSFSEKGYVYPMNMKFGLPQLVISDPLNQSADIGISAYYTKYVRNIFRVSYLSIRINQSCKEECHIRQRILLKTKQNCVNNNKPCCLLKRLFKSLQLLQGA